MRKTLNIVLAIFILSFVSCTPKEEEEENKNTEQTIFKATINGQTFDYESTSNEITSYAEATLWDNKRLVIDSYDFNLNTSLKLTTGETFLETPLQEGTYKIGTLQNDLETNILYYNSNDTSSSTNYLSTYGCNVLANEQVGEINITNLDTENKIVSGTFSGNLFRWINITTGELKSIEVTNGIFKLPYTNKSVSTNPNKNIISARVNGFRLMTDDPGSPNSRRSLSSGIDKITVIGYDRNFGRVQIGISSNVTSGNNYNYQPDGSFKSLGIRFENRINIPEGLLSNNPNQSNNSYISIINHDDEANIIEGNFFIENSEIMNRTITDGYFKVKYIDEVD